MPEYKIVLFGAGGVGKSAIVTQFVHGRFCKKYDPTIEDSYRKQVEIDGRVQMLDILDTAGQDEYSAMRGQYMKSGQGFILVFALNDRSSLDELEELRERILTAKEDNDGEVPIIIVGNKSDLREDPANEDPLLTEEEVQDKLREWGAENHKFFETSAMNNVNIFETFEACVREMQRLLGDDVAVTDAIADANETQSDSQGTTAASGTTTNASAPPKKKKGWCNIL